MMLSSLLEFVLCPRRCKPIFFPFHPINIYLVHITYRKGMYTSHSVHEEEE